jgi:hypothetical protein
LQDLGRRLNQAIQSVSGQSTIDEQVRSPSIPPGSLAISPSADR